MKREYTFSQLCIGDIILYKIKNNKYCRGIILVVGDNEVVTLVESLDEYLK